MRLMRRTPSRPDLICLCAGVVVGNAQPELLHWLVQQPQGGKVIYSDACFADGIMEGLARHGLF